MAKFGIAAIALLAASANAFAPANTRAVHSVESTSSAIMAAATEAPLSPATIWGPKIGNIVEEQKKYNSQTKPDFAPTISAKDLGLEGDKDAQLKYVTENAMEIKTKMVENGAVVFRDFELMKEQEGFVKFYEALGMKTCLDPLHSVSARPTVDGKKDSPVYEAVNKESRKNFFIGEYITIFFARWNFSVNHKRCFADSEIFK
jgi:hypothetical protein